MHTHLIFIYLTVIASVKRKRAVLSMEQKRKALKNHDSGETMQKIAAECGEGYVTVGDWKRKEVEKWCHTRASNEGLKERKKERKTMNKWKSGKVSEALYLQFTQQWENGMPITGPLLQEVLHFQKEFNERTPDFTISAL